MKHRKTLFLLLLGGVFLFSFVQFEPEISEIAGTYKVKYLNGKTEKLILHENKTYEQIMDEGVINKNYWGSSDFAKDEIEFSGFISYSYDFKKKKYRYRKDSKTGKYKGGWFLVKPKKRLLSGSIKLCTGTECYKKRGWL